MLIELINKKLLIFNALDMCSRGTEPTATKETGGSHAILLRSKALIENYLSAWLGKRLSQGHKVIRQ